ncbi:aspartate carbamoyltransferase [Paraliobacillus quinghaiensis]|uniref:Aspartate carbamoyltransferase n=1 Tax=Paraliobacillus quinghaiensis TaxID=470815 RepID=A0A917WQD5_9BACI|nr:aspartate carbamoyltransferase catalytic subunit [Paraliobacillus quinghaiensis]GGM20830.1 aspartate carbamoyltransferase [Paraliobacillus quinghaiensis]
MNHFVSMKNLSEHEMLQLIKLTNDFEINGIPHFNEKIFAANLFFEPSTRTKMSFVVAQKKLGIETLDFHAEASSLLKGESMYDTAKTFEAIGAQLLVVRHPEDHAVQELAKRMTIPVINAGDGSGEHPTQSLLDLYTMYQEFQSFKGLNVVIIGDIKHSRVARSNAYALKTLGANVYLSTKKEWQDETLDFPYIDIDDAVAISDVVMLLRVQLERHQDNELLNDAAYLEQYGLTKKREQNMLRHAIIMHPAPVNRGVEIDSDLVESKRSRIFKQMENGVVARMAIIYHLFQTRGIGHATAFNKRKTSISK